MLVPRRGPFVAAETAEAPAAGDGDGLPFPLPDSRTQFPIRQLQSSSTLMEANEQRRYANGLDAPPELERVTPPAATTTLLGDVLRLVDAAGADDEALEAGTTMRALAAESVNGFSLTCLSPPSSAMSVITKRWGRKVRITLEINALYEPTF